MQIAALGLLWPAIAFGHARSESLSTWRVDGASVTGMYSIAAREATRLAPETSDPAALGVALGQHLVRTIHLTTSGACTLQRPATPLPATPGQLRIKLAYVCPAGATLELRIDALFDGAASHTHIAQVRTSAGATQEWLFRSSERSHRFSLIAAGSALDTAAAYVRLGIEHILSGSDHLAFVAGLVLLSTSLRRLFWLITGFTLGHSLTLALAVLGWLHPEPSIIEALIGFTIVVVSVQGLGQLSGNRGLYAALLAGLIVLLAAIRLAFGIGLPLSVLIGALCFCGGYLMLTRSRAPPLVAQASITATFGLVHGMGFAVVLLELGLPPERLAISLAAFNIGVEFGQLAVVAVLWTLLSVIRSAARGVRLNRFEVAISLALAIVGGFWFITRGLVA